MLAPVQTQGLSWRWALFILHEIEIVVNLIWHDHNTRNIAKWWLYLVCLLHAIDLGSLFFLLGFSNDVLSLFQRLILNLFLILTWFILLGLFRSWGILSWLFAWSIVTRCSFITGQFILEIFNSRIGLLQCLVQFLIDENVVLIAIS